MTAKILVFAFFAASLIALTVIGWVIYRGPNNGWKQLAPPDQNSHQNPQQ